MSDDYTCEAAEYWTARRARNDRQAIVNEGRKQALAEVLALIEPSCNVNAKDRYEAGAKQQALAFRSAVSEKLDAIR